jgi:4-amino-4-deoxy-L-arabinose transferase-like glycosyltransferase
MPVWQWVAIHAGAVLFLAVLCYGTGRALIARLPCSSDGLRAAIATGAGLCVFGQLLFIAATFGALTRGAVFALLALMALLSARFVRELWLLIVRAPKSLLWMLGGGSILPFLHALYPPTGWDATMYHLTYARVFAETGSLVYIGHMRFPVFPQLNEMWFTAALLVANDVTAQLTQFLCFVATAAAVGAMARPLAGLRGAWLAIAILCSAPVAAFLASNAYVEWGLTMAVTLAVAAWSRWRVTAHAGWAFLIGVFAGMAAATKYNGLLFLAWSGVAMLVVRSPRRIRDWLLFALAVLLVAAPWYARIAAWTGNPVFPYATSVFGANDWRLDAGASLHPHHLYTAPTVRLWLTRNLYNLRLWVLALTPLAAIGAFFDRRVRFSFFGALLFVAVFWRYDSRFMLPCIPLLAIPAAVAIPTITAAMRERMRGPVMAAAAILALLPTTVWNLDILRVSGAPPRTAAQRDAYLAKRIWPYDAIRFLQKTAGAARTVYVFYGENGSYYWPGRYLGDFFGPYRYELVLPYLDRPEQLASVLRSFGVEYAIAPPAVGFRPPPGSPFELVYSSRSARAYRIRSSQ